MRSTLPKLATILGLATLVLTTAIQPLAPVALVGTPTTPQSPDAASSAARKIETTDPVGDPDKAFCEYTNACVQRYKAPHCDLKHGYSGLGDEHYNFNGSGFGPVCPLKRFCYSAALLHEPFDSIKVVGGLFYKTNCIVYSGDECQPETKILETGNKWHHYCANTPGARSTQCYYNCCRGDNRFCFPL